MNGKRKRKTIDRRQFLKKATRVTGSMMLFPYIVPSSSLGKAGTVAPSNRITLGCIGAGPQGQRIMTNFMQTADAQVIAVCDVNKPIREEALQLVNNHYGKKLCAAYNDFQQLLARDDIDAVSIASPDHWHVIHALEAVKAGKDMYVEKPLGLSVEQGQILRDAVIRYGRIFQFGTHHRSYQVKRFACELVLNGRIGKVHTIKIGSMGGRYSKTYPPMPVPKGLDYERWLGPAPWAPYTEKRVINDWWWHTSEYSLGFVAGYGIHWVDIAQWGNGTQLTGPVEVEGTGVFPRDGLCDCAVSWDVNLKYADGVRLSYGDWTRHEEGIRFEGTEGWVHVAWGLDAHPKSLLREKIGPEEIHLPATDHHQQNLLDCIKTRGRTVCPIEVAVRSDTICHISDIAMRLGRKLRWNPEKEEFINDTEANRMLRRATRSPWHLKL
jgi:predicted dehydrogenase